ncbi:MAG: excinuclease ABC subunit C [Bacteroidetes bacterium HGW-Bacteroidetes-17]|nr:MAG: excinuclease ABC subunit C [Bacteroidetes bacterium HGW-Bacteroidetes-17]
MDTLKEIIKSLPGKPGVYQYFNKDEKIIYVGKAKNLKKRVSSYFNKDQTTNGKVGVLVKNIADIKFIVVETEFDALLLENNLIKKYQPRYNVLLKDDKSFPWICIKNEDFPRVISTRHLIKDGSVYFGPYASVRMMNTLLDLTKQLYPLRNCNHNLSESNIIQQKFKVCLEYHIGNCMGPCVGKESKEEYSEKIAEITDIIKGNISTVANQLKKLMSSYAQEQAFEKAQIVKEKLELLDRYKSKSTVVNPKIDNVDVISIITDEHTAFANFLKVVDGAIIQAHSIEIKKKLNESPEELLAIAVVELHQRFQSNAKEIILSHDIKLEFPGIKFTIPKQGDKKKLLELSERNAKYYKLDKLKQKSLVDPERHSKRILNQLMEDLRLKELPVRIECFDNSNMQGDYPVAAMVSFKNAKPDKKEYRHYNIKTVEGPNDFASMEEIIYRRYKRLTEEKKELPQLIVVDGGKGQLSAAIKSLEKLSLRGKIAIIGIAKKLEEIYFPDDSIPLYIDKKSESLKVIQQLRDEAHRFGITHHRKKMEKGTIKSVLSEIEGIGYSTTQKLLWKFKSVKNVQEANLEEITKVIGNAKANIILEYFKKIT